MLYDVHFFHLDRSRAATWKKCTAPPASSMRSCVKNAIRRLRCERGLTQQQLGEAMSVSRQTINAIETEHYMPTLPLAIALARYFDTPVEEIFDDRTRC